jgi:transcriptional regulator with XRE-family HTH domain
VDQTLGSFLEARLKADGLSVRAFARKLGATSSYVSKVIHGTRPVPYSRIADWSAALGLHGEVAEEFRELALLALSPVDIRKLVAELRQGPEKGLVRKGRSRP